MRHLKLGVLLSGGGTTLENVFDHIAAGKLDAEVVVVGASRRHAYGLRRANKHGVPTFAVDSSRYKEETHDFQAPVFRPRVRTRYEVLWRTQAFSNAVFKKLGRYEFDLLLLAGFMCLLEIPDEFDGRVMNIHPALIPAFCGKGYYGHHVHEAVLDYGAKVSGCTVHFADNVYDHGPVIVQKTVRVFEDDTPDTLRARVFEKECEAYPEAIRLFGEGRLKIEGHRVRILDQPEA